MPRRAAPRSACAGDGDHLRVIVEDNGVGFAPDKLCAASGKMEGFGLFSIRERLNYFGGHMEIESIPGEVTRVILTIPLKPDKKKRNTRLATPTPTRVPLPAASEGSIPDRRRNLAAFLHGRAHLAALRPASRLHRGGVGLPLFCRAGLTGQKPHRTAPAKDQVAGAAALSAPFPPRRSILSFALKYSIIISQANRALERRLPGAIFLNNN